MQTVESLDDIPDFANEDEEAEFWATHGLGEALLEQMRPIGDDEDLPPVRPRPVEVHLDADTLRRLHTLAEVKHTSYQKLLSAFVVERLYEEEKRAGLVG